MKLPYPMVKNAYARFQSGELSEEAAKTLVKDQLRKVRYGKTDEYYYIVEGKTVLVQEDEGLGVPRGTTPINVPC